MFMVSFIFLNLFIAVIFEAFDESAQKDEIFSEVIQLALKRWRQRDPHCISVEQHPLSRGLKFSWICMSVAYLEMALLFVISRPPGTCFLPLEPALKFVRSVVQEVSDTYDRYTELLKGS